ncbi:MAG: DUF1214 domain-containing protein [Acidimicrobiales bacterium]
MHTGRRVTLDDFPRAESDINFARLVDKVGIGNFSKDPRPLEPADAVIVRQCYDFMYALGVFDLTNPITLSLPQTDRYLSLTAISQDHYVKLLTTQPGSYSLSEADIGTRYVWIMYRIFVNALDEADIAAVNDLQDAITVEQADKGSFEIPDWSHDDLDAIRSHLAALRAWGNGPVGSFGDEGELDPVRRLLGVANGWAGIPDHHVRYVGIFNPAEYPTHCALTVGDVPVRDFWSITVYDADGYVQPNDAKVYSINNQTALRNPDGTITVNFGGPEGLANRLATMPGWNAAVRLYGPSDEIRNGTWKFPMPEPVVD